MAAAGKSKTANTVFWALLGLLILSLGGFGVTSFTGNVRSIGKVGDRDIPVALYANALRRQIDQVSQQIGSPLSFQQAQAFGIDRTVRAQVVTTAALDNETDRLGISVGDDRVRTAVLAIPAFRGLDGNFNRLAYTDTLSQNRLTEVEFEAQTRDDSARSLLQGAIVGGLTAPDIYVNTLDAYLAQSRGFTLLKLDASALTEPVGTPDDAQIQAWYDALPEAFTRPEAKQITYAKLLPDMLLDSAPVDEAALQQLYQDHIAEFIQPERRLVERLVVGTEADATAAKARIEAGEITFEALVAERGLVLADIDLGDISREDLGAAGDAVFGLTAPGIVGPFTSPLGPALFRMNAVIAAQETSFDQAREGLVAEFSIDQARRAITAQIPDIEDRLASGATLEELADETDLEIGKLDYFDGTEDPVAGYPAVRTAADALTANDFPEVTTLADGGIIVLRLDSVTPPTLRPLPEVKDAVIAAWQAAETQTRLTARAEALKTAPDPAMVPEVIAPMTRDGFVDGAPETLVPAVFKMALNDAQVIAAPDGVYLVTLTSITDPGIALPVEGSSTTDADALRAQIRDQAAQSMAGDVFDLFATALENEVGIRIDDAAINAVHAQFQ